METIQVRDLEDDTLHNWTIEQMLDEINRDRSENWTDYNESDYLEGWDEWVEGFSYTRHI